MNLLKTFVESKLTCYENKFDNWKDAVQASCNPMIEQGVIDQRYVEAIFACVEKYGPYICIAPNIAIPHSTEGAEGVSKTAIGFMHVNESVYFDENDPDKNAKLFFVLASSNHEEHMNNMMALTSVLMNEEVVNELLKATCDEDLLKIADKYFPED